MPLTKYFITNAGKRKSKSRLLPWVNSPKANILNYLNLKRYIKTGRTKEQIIENVFNSRALIISALRSMVTAKWIKRG